MQPLMLDVAWRLGYPRSKSEVSLSWLVNSKTENEEKRRKLYQLNPKKYRYVCKLPLCVTCWCPIQLPVVSSAVVTPHVARGGQMSNRASSPWQQTPEGRNNRRWTTS